MKYNIPVWLRILLVLTLIVSPALAVTNTLASPEAKIKITAPAELDLITSPTKSYKVTLQNPDVAPKDVNLTVSSTSPVTLTVGLSGCSVPGQSVSCHINQLVRETTFVVTATVGITGDDVTIHHCVDDCADTVIHVNIFAFRVFIPSVWR